MKWEFLKRMMLLMHEWEKDHLWDTYSWDSWIELRLNLYFKKDDAWEELVKPLYTRSSSRVGHPGDVRVNCYDSFGNELDPFPMLEIDPG